MPIEIPFMSTNFCMFTQFIYEHMTIYRNLTPNIIKGPRKADEYASYNDVFPDKKSIVNYK